MECDKFEAGLRNSATYKRLSKLRSYLEDQKRILQKMNAAVEVRRQTIASTSERFDLYEKRYQDGMAKYENIDKENLEEISRYRKYFDQLGRARRPGAQGFRPDRACPRKGGGAACGDAHRDCPCPQGVRRGEGQIRGGAVCRPGPARRAQGCCAESLRDCGAPTAGGVQTGQAQPLRVPVALVNGNKCGGCNMELPAVVARRLKEQDIVECDNCGRILYLQDNA